MTTYGRADTREILLLPEGWSEDYARAKFTFPDGPLPLVPFVDVPRPADTPGTIWHAGEAWSDDAVTRTWTPQSVPPSLESARAHMAAILDALPLPVQAYLWTTRVAVESALDRGRVDIARTIIEATDVPDDLEETKTNILTLFP